MLKVGRITNVEPIQGCHKVTIAYKNGHKTIRFAHNHLENPSKNTVTLGAAQAWLEEKDKNQQANKEMINKLNDSSVTSAELANQLLGNQQTKHPKKLSKKRREKVVGMLTEVLKSPLLNKPTKTDQEVLYKIPTKTDKSPLLNKPTKTDKDLEHKKHFDSQLHSDARDQLINKDMPKLAPNATHKRITEGVDYLYKLMFKRNPEYTYHRLLMNDGIKQTVGSILDNPAMRAEYKKYLKKISVLIPV